MYVPQLMYGFKIHWCLQLITNLKTSVLNGPFLIWKFCLLHPFKDNCQYDLSLDLSLPYCLFALHIPKGNCTSLIWAEWHMIIVNWKISHQPVCFLLFYVYPYFPIIFLSIIGNIGSNRHLIEKMKYFYIGIILVLFYYAN